RQGVAFLGVHPLESRHAITAGDTRWLQEYSRNRVDVPAGPFAEGAEVFLYGVSSQGSRPLGFSLEPGDQFLDGSSVEARIVYLGLDDFRRIGPYGRRALDRAVDWLTFRENETAFLRGDVDRDARIDLSDAVALLKGLFRGQELPCRDAADTDDDGVLSVTDALRVLNFLFRSGAPPEAPYPDVGIDTSVDQLGCRWPF
ncbi:MAG: hypothetical protein AAF517_22800, partial [Planctomycetota bacterium]